MKPASSIKFLLFTLVLFTGLSFNAYAGPVCGDGVIDLVGPPTEECDDGNTDNDDGCNSTCMEEAGWTCINQTPTIPNSVCDLTPTTTTTTTTTTTAAPTTTTTTTAEQTTTTTSTTSTTEGTTSTTEGTTSTTEGTTSTTEGTTSTTEGTTSTTEGTTSTTEGTTSTTEGTTSTTEGTTTTTSTTTTADTTTTTQVPGQCSGKIVIGDSKCRVKDQEVGGQCLSDAIAACDDGGNHGSFVRCVVDYTRAVGPKGSGDITAIEKGRINSCAARSDIGR